MSKGGYKNSKGGAEEKSMFDFMFILKSVAVAYSVSVVLLVLVALIATLNSMSDKGISVMVNMVTALGVIACGFLTGRHSGHGGMIAGAVAGVIYTLILCLIGNLASQKVSFDVDAITAQVIGIVCGGVGGIVGINTKRRRR